MHSNFASVRAFGLSLLVGVIFFGIVRPAAAQSDRYGVTHDNIAVPQSIFQRTQEAGFGWIRFAVYWNRANPARDVYEWQETDQQIAFAKAAGLKILVTYSTPATWVTGASYPNELAILFCLNSPGHPDCQGGVQKIPSKSDFETFARALVGRYANDVDAWGWGTEVHNPVFWTGSPQQYVERILAPGYQVVKQLDPSAVVVGPEVDLEGTLEELLNFETAYGQWCDVISFHILRQSQTPGGVEERLNSLRGTLDRVGKGRPVWMTEVGSYIAPRDCNEENGQVFWLGETIARMNARSWVQRIFIYRISNTTSTDAGFGLLNSDGNARAIWYFMKSLITGQQPTAYLAEGAAGGFFDMDVAIANPNCTPASARVTFLRESGAPIVQDIALGARSRITVRADDVVAGGNPGTVATSVVVQSTNGAPLVVERTMFWDANYYAGHTGSAVTQPEKRWYFGEGSQGFFDTFVLLANSTGSAANVTVRFLVENGAPVARQYAVAANARVTVFAGDLAELRGKSFSIVVDSPDVPIIAERAMYFGTPPFWNAGHESAGVPAPATSWFHAEGATGDYFDAFILVGNPNDTAANLTFTYLLDTGTVVTKQKTLPAQSRLTVHVDSDDPLLANAAVSTTVTSDVPVVSERAMYWPGGFTSWFEAHNSFGVTETGTRWVLAEGRVGGPRAFDTYILLANPTTTDADVDITFLRENNFPITRRYKVRATSRFNVHPGDIGELANQSFGALIESINEVPIVVERAMYWNALGVTWAGGTNATAARLR